MKTPTQLFIEASIKGGWSLKAGRLDHHRPDADNFIDEENSLFHHKGICVDFANLFLDSELFKCAGVALGWGDRKHGYKVSLEDGHYCLQCKEENWQGIRHQFLCEHVPSGKSYDEFFKQFFITPINKT
ncbi:MAG: hypothetical protein AAB815_03025 [Patescibacteria group bacterium]